MGQPSRCACCASTPDGVTEADRFGNCPGCGQWFDMRDLGQVLEHVHDQEIEIGEGPAPLRKETHWGRRKLARDQ
jgi:hypothetical protein